ncbi:MAG: peptide chain release factor 1 [Myxococcales bacterium]|nr:peptide chain release factor 1 [Myxococcales bacterium]
MFARLDEVARKYDELSARMADPGTFDRPGEFQRLAKEVATLEPVVLGYRARLAVLLALEETRLMAEAEGDAELRALARAELVDLESKLETLSQSLRLLLLPRDPNDEKNIILEIRAGTGGEEASLFAADLFRMYGRYAERRGWRLEILSHSASEARGYKEIIASISGQAVFSTLKFEGGVHRVQRVPETEAQGRIHTSACTVAVLPEAEDVELDIPDRDLRIDVYRSSGPGGQSVNTTDSAVRITHLPSGLVVICQDEKSQHKNKAKAMKVLRSRLLDQKQAEQHAERAETRKAMVGSGDRSERIRTYNFPQNRITDHRIGLTLYSLDQVVDGQLDPVLDPLRAWYQATLLEATGDAFR